MDPLLERLKEDQKRIRELFERIERIEGFLKSIALSNQAILLQMEKITAYLEAQGEKK